MGHEVRPQIDAFARRQPLARVDAFFQFEDDHATRGAVGQIGRGPRQAADLLRPQVKIEQ